MKAGERRPRYWHPCDSKLEAKIVPASAIFVRQCANEEDLASESSRDRLRTLLDHRFVPVESDGFASTSFEREFFGRVQPYYFKLNAREAESLRRLRRRTIALAEERRGRARRKRERG